MNKFPFSASGFANLQSELYDLPNSELALEAASISSSLIDWLKSHFILEAKQITYLHHINAQVIDFLTHEIHFAIKNRLPIYLNKSTENFGDEQGKLIKPTSNLTATSEDGSFMPGGELIIDISYTRSSKTVQNLFEEHQSEHNYNYKTVLS